jgi:DNA-binding response OmpR family regulator
MARMTQSAPLAGRRVLIVDDEVVPGAAIGGYPQQIGFRTTVAYDGESAVSPTLSAQRRDVLIFDFGPPRQDRADMCHEARRRSNRRTLMLTDRKEEADKLGWPSSGADDHLTAPFDVQQPVAWVEVLPGRPRAERGSEGDERSIGLPAIDGPVRWVLVAATEADLTRTEFDLAVVPSSRLTPAFSRRPMIDQVWKAWAGDVYLVDVQLAHVRRELSGPPPASLVQTVRGVGYRMGPAK